MNPPPSLPSRIDADTSATSASASAPAPAPAPTRDTAAAAARGSPLEVLRVFLVLGLTSFGGPVAHLGYFRAEFVERRRWLDDRDYADLVALCQFLPGPASSQVGIALGLGRAGWAGSLAAWAGFTLPSAVLLIAFAYGVGTGSWLAASGAVRGLKLVAVAIVAQAVWGMAKSLCADRPRAGIATVAALLVLVWPSAAGQLVAIVLGALAGGRWLATGPLPVSAHRDYGVGRRTGALLLALFAALLGLLPVLASVGAGSTGGASAGDASLVRQAIAVFYQAGALVFGGGHVVLPLLQAGVVPPGWVDAGTFLAGYGAAQAVPGPLFTFAAFLGAAMPAPLGGWSGGLVLLAAIFVPAWLLVVGALPFWEGLRRNAGAQRVMAGTNAAVVGVLGAALYDPVWTGAVHGRVDVAVALAAFGLLVFGRVSPVWVVLAGAVAGWALG